MHEYKTARTIFGFMEFLSWAVVVIGVIAAFALANAGGSRFGGMMSGGAAFGAAMPGIILAIFGLFGVMYVQTGRATVDTAEMTGKMLKNSNEELKLLKAEKRELAERLGSAEPSVAPAKTGKTIEEATSAPEPTAASAKQEEPAPPHVTTYKGLSITQAGMGVSVNGQWFKSEDIAKEKIDAGEVPMIGKRG